MSAWRRSIRRGPRRLSIAALLTPILILAFSATAHAEVSNHPFIGAVISGLEPEPKPLRPKLEDPCGVAVNPGGGETYVSDYLRQEIIGASLPDLYPDNGPCALANDGNSLYVNYWHGAVVNVEGGVIDSARSYGIALDQESKNLYVNQRHSVAVYEAPVEAGNSPVMEIGTGGSLVESYGVAVSTFPATAGWVYAADASDNTVKVYNPAVSKTAPIKIIDGAGTPQGGFVSLVDASLAINQSNGELLVVDNTQPGFEHPAAVVDEFNAEGLYRGQLEHPIVDSEPTGLAVDESTAATNGQLYVTSGNGSSIVIPPELGPPVAEQGALYAFGAAGPGQTLEVTRSGTGQGSVSSSPAGIACPGACKAELNVGVLVNLTATPDPGSAFVGWSGGGCSGSGACQLTLGAPTTVDAEFGPAPAFSPPHSTDTARVQGSAGPGAPGTSSLLRLGRQSAAGTGSAVLRVSVPAAGTLAASGKGLRRARAVSGQAGQVRLRLHLNSAGRRKLARRGLLSLRVAVSFMADSGGAAITVAKTVTFKTK